MKKILCYIMAFAIIISFSGCKSNSKTNVNVPKEKNSKTQGISLDIMVTNKYLYNIVKSLTGDKDNVQFMFSKDDSNIRQFKYTSDSLNNISKYDLFIYTSADFEPWVSGFQNKLDKSKIGAIDVSRGTKMNSLDKDDKKSDENIDKNPYYWGNFDNYNTVLLNIRNALEEKDPKSRDYYEEKFKSCVKAVRDMEKEFKDVVKDFDDYTFVTTQYKFDYFFSYNGLKSVKVKTQVKGTPVQDISDKISNQNKVCFIYDDDKDLNDNIELVKKYSMKTLKFNIYYENGNLVDMMKKNEASMKKIINN
ncbi:metal ABC transporter substrate-binding protein [Clostridium neuense]|uniref:Metal ABC transporter substrate-binding protein n=1 Tax=Clostridium neuense TaxID=1728934 RepID=A0ABW8TD76_9CLOT